MAGRPRGCSRSEEEGVKSVGEWGEGSEIVINFYFTRDEREYGVFLVARTWSESVELYG